MTFSRRSFCLGIAVGLSAQQRAAEVPVRVYSNLPKPSLEIASFGLPLPPGMLDDPELVTVIGRDGAEIEASVQPLEPWRRRGATGKSIRSVLVQFPIDFRQAQENRAEVIVAIGRKRSKNRAATPFEATLMKARGLDFPRVECVLPARWLCDSRVGGPQIPSGQGGPYAAFDALAERNFPGSLKYLTSRNAADWLFDRTSAYYYGYVRTGNREQLEAAVAAARFVSAQTQREGPHAGMFKLKSSDLKYVYPRAMHLHYLLTGDDNAREAGIAMARYCMTHWDPRFHPDRPSGTDTASGERGYWTPRHQAYGWLGVLHGWELTGEPEYWQKALEYAGATDQAQNAPPDGKPPDGSWRMNWSRYDRAEASFEGGASPWMTDILCDALFQYWTASEDPKVPGMIEKWCDFLDARGIQPAGDRSYYVVNCFAPPGKPGGEIGVDMESHNLEICHTFAMGAYFTTDPDRRARYLKRVEQLLAAVQDRELNWPPRAYGWALQSSGQMMYFLSSLQK